MLKNSAYSDLRFAALYSSYRPRPPRSLIKFLLRVVNIYHPPLVIDLGNRTGLSTVAWESDAQKVIGLEKNANMWREAIFQDHKKNVMFVGGDAEYLPFPDDYATIVTCSQALHWMNLGTIFHEIRRVLIPNGLLAVYDYEFPPYVDSTISSAINDFFQYCNSRTQQLKLPTHAKVKKSTYLDNLKNCGMFVGIEKTQITVSALRKFDDLIGHVMSLGTVYRLIAYGDAETILALKNLKKYGEGQVGSGTVQLLYTYNIHLGIAI